MSGRHVHRTGARLWNNEHGLSRNTSSRYNAIVWVDSTNLADRARLMYHTEGRPKAEDFSLTVKQKQPCRRAAKLS